MGLTNVLVFEIEGLLGLTIRTTISSSKPLEALQASEGFVTLVFKLRRRIFSKTRNQRDSFRAYLQCKPLRLSPLPLCAVVESLLTPAVSESDSARADERKWPAFAPLSCKARYTRPPETAGFSDDSFNEREHKLISLNYGEGWAIRFAHAHT